MEVASCKWQVASDKHDEWFADFMKTASGLRDLIVGMKGAGNQLTENGNYFVRLLTSSGDIAIMKYKGRGNHG